MGLQSTFAPTSKTITDLPGTIVGNTAPMAGRSIPLIRPNLSKADAIAAPECPAETTASASLPLTKFIATLIEALGLRRIPVRASSFIVTTSSAWTTSIDAVPLLSYFLTRGSICSRSPTNKISKSSSVEARTAPATISFGAKSPPIASTAILARVNPI